MTLPETAKDTTMSVRTRSLKPGVAPLLFCLLSMGLPPQALAGRLLDAIRDVDVNDYALGVGISTSNSPYADTDASRYLYPYLTSLQDPTLTDNALLIEGSEIGGRLFSSNSAWEFGVVGRLQTLGFGPDTGPALAGLPPRGWTLEAGGMAGWRGGPVQVNLKHYWELLGRHSGTTQELRFAYPRTLQNGYVVPYVTLIRQSSKYANYYFGITPAETAPDREAYDTGSALNVVAGVRWGYRLTPDWLLSVSAEVENLDDAIIKSNLVDKDYTHSVMVGLAYNRALFRRHQALDSDSRTARWELSAAYIDAHIDSIQRIDDDVVSQGSPLKLEDSLGLSKREKLIAGRLAWRFAYYHRLEAEYLRISRQGSATLVTPISVGAATLLAGETISSDSVLELPQASYGYSIIRDAQKEVGVSFGLHVPTVRFRLAANDSNVVRTVRATAPLPVLGVFGSLGLPADLSLRARLQFFRLDVDNYDGNMTKLEFALDYAPIDRLSVSLGWIGYRLSLDAADDDFRGRLKLDYQGPQLAASLRF